MENRPEPPAGRFWPYSRAPAWQRCGGGKPVFRWYTARDRRVGKGIFGSRQGGDSSGCRPGCAGSRFQCLHPAAISSCTKGTRQALESAGAVILREDFAEAVAIEADRPRRGLGVLFCQACQPGCRCHTARKLSSKACSDGRSDSRVAWAVV
jgi:hypothetical protein